MVLNCLNPYIWLKTLNMDLKEIVDQFLINQVVLDISPFGNGHINSTYKVTSKENQEYILQKLNTQVFTNPHNIVNNHIKLQESICSDDLNIPSLIKTNQNQYLYFDNDNSAWRMMDFIKDSYSIEVVQDNNQAYEAGKGFGWFLKSCSNLNSINFTEAIKDFHSLIWRTNQLNDAIESDRAKRLKDSKYIIDFYKQREGDLLEIEELLKANKVPWRVVHNDTKINNLLFRDEKAVAVIDLDTVGPGVVLFDYGDAIRTITNTAAEDEKDLCKVDFNISAYESFTKGYLEQSKSVLNVQEKDLLLYASFYMTFIMGIRFLADYLNGDIYYKTKYDNHNLDRCLVQKTLIEKMESRQNEMRKILEKYAI